MQHFLLLFQLKYTFQNYHWFFHFLNRLIKLRASSQQSWIFIIRITICIVFIHPLLEEEGCGIKYNWTISYITRYIIMNVSDSCISTIYAKSYKKRNLAHAKNNKNTSIVFVSFNKFSSNWCVIKNANNCYLIYYDYCQVLQLLCF